MDALEHVVGALGLIETWVLIVYGLRRTAPFTKFEAMTFLLLARFEALGYLPVLFSWCRITCGENTTSTDRGDNLKTITRDALHNLVYPRSVPGSRMRRDFAALAWAGVLIGGLPVLIFVPLRLTGGLDAETPGYLTLIPAMVGVIAIVEAIVGWVYLDTNRSSYVVTVLYLNSKVISLIFLLLGYDRLLGGSEWDGKFPTGLLLGYLQVVKICSAVVAVGGYLYGKPDEDMPKCDAMCHSCHA